MDTETSTGCASKQASFGQMVQAVLQSGALAALGLFAISVWATILVAVAGGKNAGVMVQSALSIVSLGLGTGTIALVVIAERGLGYVDFEIPSKRDLGYVLVGIVLIFLLMYLSSVFLSLFGVQEASHSVEQTAKKGNPGTLLLFIPLSWLIIGPCEELLYRNIIQKSLYDTFSNTGAVVVASVVFALAHVFVYSSGSTPAQLVGTLATIFLLSLVLGTVYFKTENLTASALVHGTFDAIAFATLYLQFTS